MFAPGFETLMEREEFAVEVNDDLRVVCIRRKPGGAMGDAAVDTSLGNLHELFGDPKFRTYGVIIDLRDIVGDNSPEVEARMMRVRNGIMEHFSRLAILVRTQAGLLQTQRMRAPDADNHAFRDAEAALHFAQTGEVRD